MSLYIFSINNFLCFLLIVSTTALFYRIVHFSIALHSNYSLNDCILFVNSKSRIENQSAYLLIFIKSILRFSINNECKPNFHIILSIHIIIIDTIFISMSLCKYALYIIRTYCVKSTFSGARCGKNVGVDATKSFVRQLSSRRRVFYEIIPIQHYAKRYVCETWDSLIREQ